MKNCILITAALCSMLATTAFSQSKSFATLHGHFDGFEDVHSFSINGFFVNLVMSLADDDDFNRESIRHVDKVRVMTIPKKHFRAKGLSVNGYVNYINREDAFEGLIYVREHGSNVRVFMKDADRDRKVYLFLVEEENSLVALEFKGNIDTKLLFKS